MTVVSDLANCQDQQKMMPMAKAMTEVCRRSHEVCFQTNIEGVQQKQHWVFQKLISIYCRDHLDPFSVHRIFFNHLPVNAGHSSPVPGTGSNDFV